MPDLVIVIPFNANQESDIDTGAADMQNYFNTAESKFIGQNVGSDIGKIEIAHLPTPHTCAIGDYVIVFAHGGWNSTNLTNNKNGVTSLNDTMAKLAEIRAERAARILFMCCFSGLDGHIASVWKAANPNQHIYGGSDVISYLYKSTRKGIIGVCLALSEI